MKHKNEQTQITHLNIDIALSTLNMYSALNGYIEVFSPTRSGMLAHNLHDTPAERWLSIAVEEAEQAQDQTDVINEVKKLVEQKKYKEARRLVSTGLEAGRKNLLKASQ